MSLYDDLGIGREATFDEIRSAYRKRAKSCHPDQGGDRAEFERIQTAHDVLADPDRRARYDETGEINEQPDNRFAELSSVIVAAFEHVVAQAGTKFRELDLIMQTRKVLQAHKERTLGAISVAAGEKAKLEELAERLSFQGAGPDILNGAMQQRIGAHERAINTAKRKADSIDQAIAYLDSYGFQANRAQLAQPTTIPIDYDSISFNGQFD